MMNFSKTFEFRAEFFDIDSMGVMWHGNYVKYLEMARCRFLDSINYNYLDMKNDGFAMPIVKMDFKYIHPIFFNDCFSIQIKLLNYESFLTFEYIFFKGNKKLCIAHSSQVAVMIERRETCFVLPQPLVDKINLLKEKYE